MAPARPSSPLGLIPGVETAIHFLRSGIRWALHRLVGENALLATHRLYHTFLRRLGLFEPPESPAVLALLAAVAARSGSILDIGANVGLYSWFFARKRAKHTPVFAFEPNVKPAALIRSTLADVAGLHVFTIAIGDEDRIVQLTVPRDAFNNPISGLGWIDAAADSGVPILMRRLDGMIASGELSLYAPLLLKIDVEGYEPAVLTGGLQLLERFRPAIYFECEPATLARVGFPPDATFLRLAAYSYTVLTELDGMFVVCTGPRAGHSNYIAVASPAIPPPAGTLVSGDVVASWALGDS